MTLLYCDPLFLEHDTGRHPEHAGRLRAIVERLEMSGVADRCARRPCPPVSIERLSRIHGVPYIDRVREFTVAGGGQIEVDTVVSPRSCDAATRAAVAVCDAVEQVVRRDDRRALCVVRPPGHHALADAPM